MAGFVLEYSDPTGGFRRVALRRPLSIGRSPDNDIVLASSRVSRRHCLLTPAPGGAVLDASMSLNHVFANGQRVERIFLTPGMGFTVGGIEIALAVGEAPEPARGAAIVPIAAPVARTRPPAWALLGIPIGVIVVAMVVVAGFAASGRSGGNAQAGQSSADHATATSPGSGGSAPAGATEAPGRRGIVLQPTPARTPTPTPYFNPGTVETPATGVTPDDPGPPVDVTPDHATTPRPAITIPAIIPGQSVTPGPAGSGIDSIDLRLVTVNPGRMALVVVAAYDASAYAQAHAAGATLAGDVLISGENLGRCVSSTSGVLQKVPSAASVYCDLSGYRDPYFKKYLTVRVTELRLCVSGAACKSVPVDFSKEMCIAQAGVALDPLSGC